MDVTDKANKLNDFFVQSVRTIHNSIPEVPMVGECTAHPQRDGQSWSVFHMVTISELEKVVKGLKVCGGIDNVNTRVLWDAFETIKIDFLSVINKSLSRGEFPSRWKKSLVVPLPKVAQSRDPADRRPINMLPLYEKVLELIVKEQLCEFLQNNSILIDEQSGFRKNHSCESALNLLLLKWKQAIEVKNVIIAVFIDLKRAFETIDRTKLVGALFKIGVRGSVLQWFKSYLTGRQQVTLYEGKKSGAIDVELGVPQGSVLGPLLFIIYINDIKEIMTDGKVNMFADDTVIFIVAEDFAGAYRKLQTELNKVSDWLKLKKLMLNVKKTKYMVITNKSMEGNIQPLRLEEQEIERVESLKYLGVIVDDKLSFNDHVDYTIRKAARKLGVIYRINQLLDVETKIMLYKSIVASHFEYCPTVLFLANRRQKRRMQRIQNKAMRLILGCTRTTPSATMRDWLHWMTVEERLTVRTLEFIFKLKNGLLPRYLTEIIQYGTDVHNHNTRTAMDLRLQNFRKAGTQNSLFYKGFQLFNRLPDEVKQANNLHSFKRLCVRCVKDRLI